MLVVGALTVLAAVPMMRMFGIVGVACVYAVSAAVQGAVNALLVNHHFALRSCAVAVNPLRALRILSHRGAQAATRAH
jgi:hypothetical protein